ncbi:MAG: alpha/beta fold hydrolase [Halobacteria archaeon]
MTEAQPLPKFIADAFPFPRRRVETRHGGMECADTGGSGRPVVMVHGNPAWSYLYRKVMAGLKGSGLRLVAPDLLGFGTSFKPRDWRWHALRRHGEALLDLVEELDLRDIVLVGQDWGGPVGTWMAAHAPERVTGLLLANTAVLDPGSRWRTTAFHRFSHMPVVSEIAFRGLKFPVPWMHVVQGDRNSIGRAEKRAYAWPFRHLRDRAGPLALARMVPNRPDHPTVPELKKTDRWFRGFTGPVEFVWGVKDPILGRQLRRHAEAHPGARVTETQAGHFLQEEVPGELAAAVGRLVGKP